MSSEISLISILVSTSLIYGDKPLARTSEAGETAHYDGLYDRMEFPEIYHDSVALAPYAFDARERWPNCTSIRKVADYRLLDADQEHGYDAAIAVASMLTDRWCIAGETADFEFSPTDIVECCKYFAETYKNAKAWALRSSSTPFAASLKCAAISGIVSGGEGGCKPTFEKITEIKCIESCTYHNYLLPYIKDKKRIKYISRHERGNSKVIKTEIFYNGPVVAQIVARESFISTVRQSDIYREDGPDQSDINARVMVIYLKIIGWGADAGIPYWLVTNFWGDEWKDGGFFKILEHKRYLGLGTRVYAAHFKNISVPKTTMISHRPSSITVKMKNSEAIRMSRPTQLLKCWVRFAISALLVHIVT